jgi:hypothetical protein
MSSCLLTNHPATVIPTTVIPTTVIPTTVKPTMGRLTADPAARADSGHDELMRMAELAPEVNVPVASLVAGVRLRQAGMDAAHVRLLADAAGSIALPPILVQKHGSRVIDGLHRLEAAKLRDEWTIRARVIDCTDQQALVLAVCTNTQHGLPLSRADRICGAKRILSAHPDWSDRAVAAITGLSAKSVASVRNSAVGDLQFQGKRLGRDGKRRPVQAGEGRRRAAEYITAHPEASLRQVARETDVSLGTVHDVRECLRRAALTVTPDGAAANAATTQFSPVQASAPYRGPVPASPAPASPVPASTVQAHTAHPQAGLPQAGLPQAGLPQAGPAKAGPAGPARPLRLAHSPQARPGMREVQQAIWSAVSAKLTGDPALRYSEGGRAFLRWMAQHSTQADEWREFIDAVPEHWRPEVSRIALTMSEEWRQFADQLQSSPEIAS